VKYLGWIPGKETDRRVLRQLGVRGKMIYDPHVETTYGIGAFEHCEVSRDVLMKLIGWGLPNVGSFTAVNRRGRQLPRRKQNAWRYYRTGIL
jgi:hypothetical protein